jgi:hypothetical protein
MVKKKMEMERGEKERKVKIICWMNEGRGALTSPYKGG